jgi:hypothetical protein
MVLWLIKSGSIIGSPITGDIPALLNQPEMAPTRDLGDPLLNDLFTQNPLDLSQEFFGVNRFIHEQFHR